MDFGSLAIAVGVCGLFLCAGYAALYLFDRFSVAVDARLAEMTNQPSSSASLRLAPRESDAPSYLEHWRAALNRLVPNSEGDRRRCQMRLMRAGIYRPTALSVFFAAKLGLMVIPPVVGLVAGGWGFLDVEMGLLWGASVGGLGMILPTLWLERRIRQRHVELRRSLADFLDLMIVCLDSGLSLQGTMLRVGDELRIAHPILAGELQIVQRDMALGGTVDVALRRFADRSGYEGIRTMSTFVREAQRFGTELAEALRLHADMLRHERAQSAEETAQKASVKILLPVLLLILPAVFVVLAGPAAIQIQAAFSKNAHQTPP